MDSFSLPPRREKEPDALSSSLLPWPVRSSFAKDSSFACFFAHVKDNERTRRRTYVEKTGSPAVRHDFTLEHVTERSKKATFHHECRRLGRRRNRRKVPSFSSRVGSVLANSVGRARFLPRKAEIRTLRSNRVYVASTISSPSVLAARALR